MSFKIPRHSVVYFVWMNVVFGGMCLLTFQTPLFDKVVTENGFKYYAETPVTVGKFRLMPMNALVNLGYVVIGLWWTRRGLKLLKKDRIGKHELTFLVVTSWMSILYGAVQCLRIMRQWHKYAVLDQWCTFPFFAWIALGFKSVADGRWSHARNGQCMAVSLLSYFLALFMNQGFELVLLAHVVLTIVSSGVMYAKLGNVKMVVSWVEAFACCVGFVVLKVYDFELVRVHVLFHTFTGHFWSKVCDVLQIHFALEYFLRGVKQSKRKMK